MVGSALCPGSLVTGLSTVTGGGWPEGILDRGTAFPSVSGDGTGSATAKVEGQGLESWASRHGGTGSSPAAPLPVARVWLWNGCWSPVCHPPYCSWFSEAVDSAATIRGLGLQDTDSAVPLVPARLCFSPPTFGCRDECIVKFSGLLLCWVEAPLDSGMLFLAIDWKGILKGSVYSGMLLTSLDRVFLVVSFCFSFHCFKYMNDSWLPVQESTDSLVEFPFPCFI